MKVVPASLAEVLLLEPRVFGGDRGFFFESFNAKTFANATGLTRTFVQDNHSRSANNVLRGLHYQVRQPQGKLVRVVSGEVFDVAVDIRKSSPTFGRWTGTILSAENRLMQWIPEGFAHGFLVLSASSDLLYKTTDYYAPEYEHCIAWNDPDIGIPWPLTHDKPILAARDKAGKCLSDAEVFR